MSVAGQSRHFGRRPAPSGLPRSKDIVRPPRHVELVPIGNIMIACERFFGGASSAVLVFATPQIACLRPTHLFRARHVQELGDLAHGKRLGSCPGL
jgi:hypothetical protein